jgi:hypothetical protein
VKKLKAGISVLLVCAFFSLGSAPAANAQAAEQTPKTKAFSNNESATPIPADKGAGLDFNSAVGQETQISNSQHGNASSVWAWSSIVFSIAAIATAFLIGRKSTISSMSIDLFNFPGPAKLTISFLLFAFGLTHALAAITVYLDTRLVYASTQEYFLYLKPARLTALSHAHLMAIATMDGIAALLFSMRRSIHNNGFTTAVITMTFIGIFGDIASWWLTKYFGESFEIASMFTGAFFSLGFIIMSVAIFRDLWIFHPSQARKAQ